MMDNLFVVVLAPILRVHIHFKHHLGRGIRVGVGVGIDHLLLLLVLLNQLTFVDDVVYVTVAFFGLLAVLS